MLVSVLRIVNKLTFGFCAAHINIHKSCGKAFVSLYEVIIRYLELFAYYNYFEFSAVKEVVRRKYAVAVNSAVRKVLEREFFDSDHGNVFKIRTTLEYAALKSLYAFGEYDFRYYSVIDESRIFDIGYVFFAVRSVVVFREYFNYRDVERFIIAYIITLFRFVVKIRYAVGFVISAVDAFIINVIMRLRGSRNSSVGIELPFLTAA